MIRALLLVLALAGCAHTDTPPLRGEPLADGRIPLSAVVTAADQDVWAPSIAYPVLRQPHDVPRARRTPHMTADGPMQATGWLAFRAYQATLSRMNGSTCRFHPTCSGFGLLAVRKHGVWGVPLTFARLQRAHAGSHYPSPNPPYLEDPLSNYDFTSHTPQLDDFAAYDDAAHAWYQHIRATRR